MTLFETKTSGEIEVNGKITKKPLLALLDKDRFSEAEITAEELAVNTYVGGYTVTDVKRSKVVDIFKEENSDTVWFAQIKIDTLDEDSGVAKAEKQTICLIAQDSIESATELLNESMKGCLSDWSIENLKRTKIEYVELNGVILLEK